MRRLTSRLMVLALSAITTGCGAHGVYKVRAMTEPKMLTAERYPAHEQKVFITAATLPAEQYEPIAQIDAGTVWYGSKKAVYELLANRGRELGADAVIEVETWHQPSGWSWAAPHGTGKAVKIKSGAREILDKFDGDWH